jgi:hypothetical protein
MIVATVDYRELRPTDPDGLRKWREWYDERDRRFERERQAEKPAQHREANMASEEVASLRDAQHSKFANMCDYDRYPLLPRKLPSWRTYADVSKCQNRL